MAVASLILSLAIFLIGHEKARAQNFGIVEPYPENLYPIEFESAKVTCVAFDPTGVKTPEKIIFVRISRIQNSVELKPNENLFLENRTEEFRVSDERNATKLFVTLNIRNVTNDDDSDGILGRYECHAFAVNDSVAESKRHGFTVNVIPEADLPQISVSANRTVKHNSLVEIACNLTEGKKATTSLQWISWYKNGELFERVRSPDPDQPGGSLTPLRLPSVGVREAGVYTCLLEVLLQKERNYNISESMELRIAPWLTPPNEDIEVKSFRDEIAQFNCAAKGNPLEVEWKVQKKGKDEVQACINGSNGKYEVKRNGPFDPYFLLVKNLQYTDRGFYYCCLPTNCSDSVDGCQRFILRVRDPLGPLWPVIGILAEALVLFLIIYIAEKRKKRKENGVEEDHITKSYSYQV
ncbi:basigin-like isoform X1 [Montipora capricornis]|uniref:basigin-like isoform X1 n=1 Tax=Montipora capricornis TaxID=246305 RepID=UPI0035F1C6BE